MAFFLSRDSGIPLQDHTVFAFDDYHDNETLVEIIASVPVAMPERTEDVQSWKRFVNKVFRQHRIGYKFVDDDLIPFEDDELMQNVVEPTLGILVEGRFQEARKSYMEALEVIADGKPGTSITHAGTALQQTFQALGCDGKVLGNLVRDAKRKGLLGEVDTPLAEGIEKFCNWAAANRNQLSAAHSSTELKSEDAWLMVHVVGALIQRLAAGTPRQAQPATQDG